MHSLSKRVAKVAFRSNRCDFLLPLLTCPTQTLGLSHMFFTPQKDFQGKGKRSTAKMDGYNYVFIIIISPNCKLLRRFKHTQDIFYYYRVQMTTNDQFNFTCLREWNEQEPSTDIRTTNCSFISTLQSTYQKTKEKRNKQQPAGLQQTILTLNKIQNIHFFHKPSQTCTVCLSLS